MEQWKKIETTNHNWISSKGRLYSTYRNKGFMKTNIDRYGYETVKLNEKGRKKDYTVHRLVALYFIENPNNFPTIDHIDNNKLNNCVENLQWMSAIENTGRAHRIPVDQFTKDGVFIKRWNSAKEAGISLGHKSGDSIYNNLQGRTKSAYGFVWKRSEN